MKRKVVDSNYLRSDKLREFLSRSTTNIAVLTPFVELEMLKGDAPITIFESTKILAEHPKQFVLTKLPDSINRLRGRRKGLKKRFTDGKRTSVARRWFRHTRNDAQQRGDIRAQRNIMRASARAFAQLADMRENARTFHENIEVAKKRYASEDLETFRKEQPFTPALNEKIRNHVMEMTQQFFEMHPGQLKWPPRDDVFYTYTFRFALCARLHALHVMAIGSAKRVERLPNDFIDVSIAAYATCFDGLLSDDKMINDIYRKARFLLDREFLKVPG